MRLFAALLALCCSACPPPYDEAPVRKTRPAAAGSDASPRGPSTAEERAKAVEAATRLEADPLAYGADEERARLTVWIMQIPDIYVKTCPALIGELEPGPLHSMMTAQMLLASTAFIIQNPKKAKDDVAVYTASLESVLRTYAAVLQVQPESRASALDALLARKREGTLASYVKDTATDCTVGG